MKNGFLIAGVLVAAMLAGCNDRGDETLAPAPLPPATPNDFLKYLNTQASLGAGDYEVVVATNTPGAAGSYTLVITRDDGSIEEVAGAWTSSGGEDPDAGGNPRHAVKLATAGGLKVALASTVNGYLYLVRNGRVVAEDDDSGEGGAPLINLPLSRISSVDYANAYYAAVDPDDERTTLEDYLRKNCFIEGNPDCAGETIGYDTHVVFRDSKDLGYGRNMYARRNTDGTVAFYVENYVIKLQPGSSSNYGPLNVEAAIRREQEFHVGTNAIEFSPRDPGAPSENITKFFTYNPAGNRLTSADLDGRGVKHMPGMCWVCHGGRLLPLEEDGSFPLLSLRSAKLNQLEADTFDYSTLAGYTRAEQEPGLRTINQFVHGSFEDMQSRSDDDPGKWYADFAMEIAEGRYGGAGFPDSTYQEDSVPAGWTQTLSRPEGVEQLYKRVIEPHCVSCHSLQGSNAAENVSDTTNAINFSSWEKFISYRETIIDYVFQRGVMPLSLRNFESFWRDPQDKPALLASFLDEPTLFDPAGKVIQPGLAVARASDVRAAASPVQLDASGSPYAQAWAWIINIDSAPLGATVSLDDPNSPRPVLTADMDGTYELTLVVGNVNGSSTPVTVTVTLDSAASDPRDLTFVDDIVPILGSVSGNECASCHRTPTAYPGIPVSYRASDNARVYADVLERVNLADPENSLLLRKPTSTRHGGGVQIDLETVNGLANYRTILDWVRNGAPCGDDPLVCP